MHVGALLLHVGAENLAQGPVHQVGAAVVVGYLLTACGVDLKPEGSGAVLRQTLRDMDGELVLLDGVEDLYRFSVGGGNGAGVAYLSAHLSVERGAVEDQLQHLLVLLHHGAALEELCALEDGAVVAGKLHVLAVVVDRPVSKAVGGGVAGAVFLLLELLAKAFKVDGIATLGGNEFRKVDGESEGVVQLERVAAGDDLGGGVALHAVVQKLDAAVQRAQERELLLADDGLDELLLGGELGVGVAHIVHQLLHEHAEERLVEAQEGVAVAHGTAEDPADDVSRFDVAGELAVGDGETDGADVVCDNAHSHVRLLALSVFVAAELAYFCEHAGKDIGVVVAVLALEHGAEALEAHSGVDILGGEGLQVAVGKALELHEDEVPDLYDVGVGLVHEVAPGDA